MKNPIVSMCACLALLLLGTTAGAAVLQKTGTFGGTKTDYLLCLPANWTVAREYPTILAFCGGAQDLGTAQYTMEANWRTEAEKRGWVVIMPIATGGELFFQDGERIFPDFLVQMQRLHRISGSKFHVAGRSNGGLSAFRVAIAHPGYFQSITVYPGAIPDEDFPLAERLKGIPIKMAFGELDPAWLQEGRSQANRLNMMGIWAWLQVEAGCNHGIESFTGPGSARLFDLVAKKK